MKNVLLAGLLAVINVLGVANSVMAFENVPVNAKALNSFKKKFTAVQNEKWYNYKNRSIVVFEAEEVRFSVEYDNKGNVTGMEKVYAEGKMDRAIRKIVKSVYFDHTITSIREISVPWLFPNPVYIIHIEDENGFKNLTVYDGEMKVVDEYSKEF
jgi:uncharacterized protein YuzE